MGVQDCDSSRWEGGGGRRITQGHLQLSRVAGVSTGYMRPCLKRGKKKKSKTQLWVCADSSVIEHWPSMPQGPGLDPQCHQKITIYRMEQLTEWGHRMIPDSFVDFS